MLSCESLLIISAGSDEDVQIRHGLRRRLRECSLKVFYLPNNVFECTDFNVSSRRLVHDECQVVMEVITDSTTVLLCITGLRRSGIGRESVPSILSLSRYAAANRASDQTTADIYIAEARFVRAYRILRWFGSWGVPIITGAGSVLRWRRECELFNFAYEQRRHLGLHSLNLMPRLRIAGNACYGISRKQIFRTRPDGSGCSVRGFGQQVLGQTGNHG